MELGMNPVQFFVSGTPVPQGSIKAFTNQRTGRAMLTSDSGPKLKDWRDAIGWEARQHFTSIIDGPVWLRLQFRITRPKSVSEKKRPWPSVKPDIDKISRAALDALSGIAYTDDAQVVELLVSKRYCETGEQPGVYVLLTGDGE